MVPRDWPGDVRWTAGRGLTSLSWPAPAKVQVGLGHATGPWPKLRFVMAHEWGHHMAFRYGTHNYLGAPPAGWPGPQNAELFANCVAEARVPGYWQNVHGVGRCPAAALAWVRTWLAAPPPG